MTKTGAAAELSATTKRRRSSKSTTRRRNSSQLGKTGASKERRESNALWVGGHSNKTGNATTGGGNAGSRDANRLRRIVMEAVRSEAPKEEGG